MSGRTFESASTPGQAVAAMQRGAVPVAGGTDLVVGTRQGKRAFPDAVVAIHEIDELRRLGPGPDGGLHIGALVTHGRLVADPEVRASYTALADASSIVGSHATRAQGTLGGNVMNASPAMDTGAALLCFDAEAHLLGPDGPAVLPLDELWTGPGRTAALPDQLLTAITLPRPASGTGSAYVRLQYRRHMEIAVTGVAAVVTVAGAEIVAARVAIAALSPVIHRVPEAEALLVGSSGDPGTVTAAADAVAAAARPISDVRGSAAYRTAMARVVFRRALSAASIRATGREVPVPASDSTFGDSHEV